MTRLNARLALSCVVVGIIASAISILITNYNEARDNYAEVMAEVEQLRNELDSFENEETVVNGTVHNTVDELLNNKAYAAEETIEKCVE